MLTWFLRSCICCLSLLPATLLAQVSFNTVPGSLSLHQNEVLQVSYMIENAKSLEDFQAPAFRDFKLVQGPVQTEGTIITNGQFSSYSSYTYVLQPLRQGRLIVPGATATIDGKKKVSNRVVVEVGPPASNSPNPYPRNPGISAFRRQPQEDYLLQPNENAEEKIRQNLLVKLDLDKTSAWVGEPIVATYTLYTRLRSESRVSKRPSLNGFSVYDMVEPEKLGPEEATLNGKTFVAHPIRKTQLIPLQEGDFTLEPIELDNKISFSRLSDAAHGPADPLEKMFGDLFDMDRGRPETHQVTIASEPRKIHIKALPAGAPASFNGAVGSFRISGHLKDSTVAAGEPLEYSLTVEGKGNLPLINAPNWNLPAGLQQMDPTVTENIDKSVAPMEGKKTFNYTITASSPGKLLLPAIEFSYFDPNTARYQSLKTDSIEVTVTAVANRKPVSPAEPLNKASTKKWVVRGGIALAALLAAGVGFLLQKNQTKAKQAAPAPAKEETAVLPPPKKDPLAGAREAMEKNDARAYYHAIEKSLWEAVAEKLALPGSEQQQPQALQQLAERGLPEQDLQLLEKCWHTCDWILYLPASAHRIEPQLLEEAEQLLSSIESL